MGVLLQENSDEDANGFDGFDGFVVRRELGNGRSSCRRQF